MPVILVDIDMTLADNREREELARRKDGTLNWGKFTSSEMIVQDGIIVSSKMLRRWWINVYPSLQIVYLTGREGTEEIIQATLWWLGYHNYPGPPVYFRLAGDRRMDWQVKEELITGPLAVDEPQVALDDCGRSYTESGPLLDMYERHGIRVVDPQELMEGRY